MHIWLADTFTGVVNAGSKDTLYRGGEHADTSVEQVTDFMHRLGISNYRLLLGAFPQDSAEFANGAHFRLAHVDLDTYESAKDSFEWIWPRVVRGGIVVFDDYGFWGCDGVTAYVRELIASGKLVIENLNGHALVIKFSMAEQENF